MDAIHVATLLVLEDANLLADLPALLLRNFALLDRDDIRALIRQALASPSMVKEILLASPRAIPDARAWLEFIHDVHNLALERTKGDLPAFYQYYWLFKTQVQTLPDSIHCLWKSSSPALPLPWMSPWIRNRRPGCMPI